MTHPTHWHDIHDHITELTRTHTHREPYEIREHGATWTKGHITTVPALVHQLLSATPSSQGSNSGTSGYASRPAGRLEALDTIMLIDQETESWLYRLGVDVPRDTYPAGSDRPETGSGTIAALTALHAAHAALTACTRQTFRRDDNGTPCCLRHHVEHDVRRWWRSARVASGWDSPAWRPDNTCPVCEQRRSLRINLTLQLGYCVECRETWGPEVIGLLADHIRVENADTDDEVSRVKIPGRAVESVPKENLNHGKTAIDPG